MGPPSYMRSVDDGNVVMRRTPMYLYVYEYMHYVNVYVYTLKQATTTSFQSAVHHHS